MDGQLQVLLLLVIVIVAVFIVITTGVHIVRPGEIGFLYRGNKFLRHFGPAFVMGPPIVSRMYRLDVRTLHIHFKTPAFKMRDEGTACDLETEAVFDIADPQRVPIRNKDLGAEMRVLASDTFEETISRMRSREDRDDPGAIAKELKISLNKAVDKMGLRVASVRVGDHIDASTVSELDRAKIPSWDDLSRKYGT